MVSLSNEVSEDGGYSQVPQSNSPREKQTLKNQELAFCFACCGYIDRVCVPSLARAQIPRQPTRRQAKGKAARRLSEGKLEILDFFVLFASVRLNPKSLNDEGYFVYQPQENEHASHQRA